MLKPLNTIVTNLNDSPLRIKEEGGHGQGKWRSPGMQEVLGSNPLGGNNLCSPSPSEETLN